MQRVCCLARWRGMPCSSYVANQQMTSPFRTFKRIYHKARRAFDDLGDPSGFQLSFSFDGTTSRAEHTTPNSDATARLAILMRPFLNPTGPLYYKTIWAALRAEFGDELTDGAAADIDASIRQMNTGYMTFTYNDQQLTAEDLYHLLSEGEYFDDDDAAAQYLKGIFEIPFAGHFIWHQFYNYTLSGFDLVSGLFGLIRHVERTERYQELYPSIEGETRCIYCLTTDGRFTSEEHVLPEALGNDELVLPAGYTCDTCNSRLSSLDSYLADFEPLAFLQVQFVPYTKKGKLPEARFQNVHFRRTGPRSIQFMPQDKSGELKETGELGNGQFSWNFKLRGRSVHFIKLGQALYKVGLALVALGDGQEAACSERYNSARTFIHTGQARPNNYLVRMTVQPQGRVQVGYFYQNGGTLIQLDLYGFVVLLNLDAQPVFELNEQLSKLDFALWPPPESAEGSAL
jgi:HNH endonuclease